MDIATAELLLSRFQNSEDLKHLTDAELEQLFKDLPSERLMNRDTDMATAGKLMTYILTGAIKYLHELGILKQMVLDEIKERDLLKLEKAKIPALPQKPKGPTQKQYAIYYRILQQFHLYDDFDVTNRTKAEMCREIGIRHNISGDKFEQIFNKTNIKDATIEDLNVVLSLLDSPEYQAAIDYTNDQIRLLETKKEIK
jgi:hypothetical protein